MGGKPEDLRQAKEMRGENDGKVKKKVEDKGSR